MWVSRSYDYSITVQPGIGKGAYREAFRLERNGVPCSCSQVLQPRRRQVKNTWMGWAEVDVSTSALASLPILMTKPR